MSVLIYEIMLAFINEGYYNLMSERYYVWDKKPVSHRWPVKRLFAINEDGGTLI